MKQLIWNRGRLWALALFAGLALAVGLSACGSSDSSDSSTSASSESTETTESTSAETATIDEAAAKAAGFPNYAEFSPPDLSTSRPESRIAFLMPETVQTLQRAIVEGAEAAADKYNVELTVFDAGGYANVTKQVGQFETAIGQGFDGITMLPASPTSLNAQIKQASDKGITVTANLIPPESEDLDFAIFDSLTAEAEISTAVLAEEIGEEGEVFGLFGGEGSAPNIFYVKGVLNALKKFPKIEMVYRKDFPAFNPAEAQTAMEDALAAHPDVNAVITNATSLNPGVQRALQSAGLESVPTIGIGPNTKPEIEGIRSGQIVSATLPAFYKSGELIIEWTAAIIDGTKPKAPLMEIPFLELSPANIEDAISTGAIYYGLTPAQLGCGPGESEEC